MVPDGQDTCKISIPTREIPATYDVPPPLRKAVDLRAADVRVKRRGEEYCATMNGTVNVTGGEFNMGSGLTVIFKCIAKP